MESIDFKKDFLEVDFDSILLECNNPLFNSDQHHIKYKNLYFDKAKIACEQFEHLSAELSRLQDVQFLQLSDTKVIRTYVDEQKILDLKQQRKNLVIKQRQELQKTLQYFRQLNDDYTKLLCTPVQRSPSISSVKSGNESVKSKRGVLVKIRRKK